MTNPPEHRPHIPPPSKHGLALMIWLCVLPTLTAINLAFGDWLRTMSSVTRTFVLATIAVPIVIYVLMPHLHRLRVRLLVRRLSPQHPTDPLHPVVALDRFLEKSLHPTI